MPEIYDPKKHPVRKATFRGIPIVYDQPIPMTLEWLYGETPAEAVFQYKQATKKRPAAIHELFGVYWGVSK